MVLCGVSLSWSLDQPAGVLVLVKWSAAFLLFWAVSQEAERLDPRAIGCAVASVGIFVGVLGIVQHLGWRPLGAPSAGMPSATLGFRNVAATFLVTAIPFAVALSLTAESRAHRMLAAASATAMVAFLVYTRTRGAWLGFVVSTVTVVLLGACVRHRLATLSSRARPLAVGAIVALLLACVPSNLQKLGPQSVDEKKTGVTDAVASVFSAGGDRGRLDVWRASLDMVADHPVLGVGLGNWSVHYPRYDGGSRVTFHSAPERPHNEPLTVLCELGVVGFGLILLLAVVTTRGVLFVIREAPPERIPWTLAAYGALVAVWGHGLFSFPFERMTPLLMSALSLGLIAGWARTTSCRSPNRPAVAATCACVVAALFFATTRVSAFEAALHRAVEHERAGRWGRVGEEIRSARSAGAFHPEVWHLGGYALNSLGDFDASLELYEEAVGRRPWDIQIRNGYALALQGKGRLDEAAAQLLDALAVVPDVPDLEYNLSGIYLANRLPGKAADVLTRLLEREGPSRDLLFRLGNARALAGDDAGAVAALERALENGPFPRAQFVLGEVHFRNGRYHEAHRHFTVFLTSITADNQYTRIARQRLEAIAERTSSP